MRARGRIATALLLAVLVPMVAVPASLASPGRVASALADVTQLPGEVAPTVVTDGAGRVALLTEVPVAGHPGLFHLLARTRSGSAPWSAPVVVATHVRWNPPAAAMTPSGALAVAWSGRHSLLTVRLATPDGVWDAPYVVGARVYGRPQVAVNAAGDVVAAAGPFSGAGRVGVRRDGVWTTTQAPDYGSPSVGIDRSGVVYAASAYADRGGDGSVTVSRQGTSGEWSRSQLVRGISRKVQQAQLLVSPHGALTLAVGYASKRWVSTLDTEAYFTTGYALLRRTSWAAPFHQVWRRDGATGLTMAASTAGRVRVTWEEWRAPDHERRPTHSLVRTRQILPRRGSGVTLASQPVTVGQGYYSVWTALADDGTATVLWQGRPAGSPDLTPVGVARVFGDRVLDREHLEGSEGKYAEASEPSLAAGDAGTWVAWTHGPKGARISSVGVLP
jgi:hypothetical protein